MNKIILHLLLLIIAIIPSNMFGQETSIQFPRLNFQMRMSQNLKPDISYFLQNDIIVGDKSGIVFTTAVSGSNLNLQSDINSLVDLNALKFTIAPSTILNFTAFYGRYKFLAEDNVLPNGFQHNFAPNANFYGIMPIFGAGLAITMPIQDSRYEPELIVFSSSYEGIDFLNIFMFMTFRFELFQFELYSGVAIPTIGSIDTTIRGTGGFMVYTTMDIFNIYFTLFVPPDYGSKFEFDDLYFRYSHHTLINGFEHTMSLTSLGSQTGNLVDPLIGLNGVPDMSFYLSLGGRVNIVGFGMEYNFVFGLFESEAEVQNFNNLSHRIGGYVDAQFLGLTYKLGVLYTLPNSAAYRDIMDSGEVGFYVSVYGRV